MHLESIIRLVCPCSVLLLGATFAADATLTVKKQTSPERYVIMDGSKPVLTYNFGTVPVAEGAKGKYAVARSDYVHPLNGPDGEVLTKDYSPDHPHHRGLYWAWPEVTYQGQKRDLHALQGVFARQVKMLRQEGGAKCAVLEAENEWRWGDKDAIVNEKALITAHREVDGVRAVDFVFTFEALVDGVTIARRGLKAYGGFNLRFSARKEQKIRMTAPEWASLTGIPPEGKGPVSVTILQHPDNPCHPGDWVQYPKLNWLQPTFPKKGEAYALAKGKPLVLRYRLLISRGELEEAAAKSAWKSFATKK
jgi:hypothetical protein